MTWLDIGNGWRNIYLLSCLAQMGALGSLFAWRGWFSRHSRVACFLTGVAATPFVQYLWTLLLAALWPHAPRLVYIGVLPLLAVVCVLALAIGHIRQAKQLAAKGVAFARRVLHFDKPALVALCFAICIVLLIGPVCVRFMSSMHMVNGGDAGEYLGLGLHFCENRDLAYLLEKEEIIGHFRGHSHFPSLELFMSHGLFHTGGDVGYPNDKACFTGLGMLTFYMAAAYAALLLHFCREKKAPVLLGAVLFNLIPYLHLAVEGAPRDLWRILALLWAVLFFAGLEEGGGWKCYVGKLIACLAVCFTVMSAHVVCFVVLPFIVVAWVLWRALHKLLTSYRGALAALGRSVGIALAGAAGTLAAFAGNIWCFLKWGTMMPWRLMNTYTDAPWYETYLRMEYKLEETTTHLSIQEALDSLLMGYASPVGKWGWILTVAALALAAAYLIATRIRMGRKVKQVRIEADGSAVAVGVFHRTRSTQTVSLLALCALIALLTLAPMSGVLDSPLYSFSGSFAKMSRYTLQWFFFGNVVICAMLSALMEHWGDAVKHLPRIDRAWVRTLPAWLCALLCLLGTVKGVNQTGYTNTFYRYTRDVMENESILLDNGYRDRFGLLMAVAPHVKEEDRILISRTGYQYVLRSEAYVINTNPIVPLLNLPLEEVEGALQEMNVAMLATEPHFWDERYLSQSTLSDYLNALPEEQIVQTDTMRLYLLDRDLIPYAQEALAQAEGGEE